MNAPYPIIIKNMVCRRCIMAVATIFREEGITPLGIELGRVTLSAPIADEQKSNLKQRLSEMGFEWIEDRKTRLIEQIRTGVIEYIQMESDGRPLLSDFLQQRCAREYSFLSKLFTEVCGRTIERYTIEQKIERVKELLFYDELTVSEIAYRMGYSSTAHLSAQFKTETGISPVQFKRLKATRSKGLDEI